MHPEAPRVLYPAVKCMLQLAQYHQAQPLCEQLLKLGHPKAKKLHAQVTQAIAQLPPPLAPPSSIPTPMANPIDLPDKMEAPNLDVDQIGVVPGGTGLDTLGGNGSGIGEIHVPENSSVWETTPRTQDKADIPWVPILACVFVVLLNALLVFFIEFTMQSTSLSMVGDMQDMTIPNPDGYATQQQFEQQVVQEMQPMMSKFISIFLNFLILILVAAFTPGILALWVGLRVTSLLPHNEWWGDLKHITLTHTINSLLFCTGIGNLLIPIVMRHRYEQTCGSLFVINILYFLITGIGVLVMITTMGFFLPNPMDSEVMMELQLQQPAY